MKNFTKLTSIFSILVLNSAYDVKAQKQTDSLKARELDKVVVTSYISPNGIGHLKEIEPPFIYAGKRTEVIVIDSVDGNKAINNTRQILGRVPGLNI
ncbi:MAG TPA: hypothetical protein VLJ41_01110, partial [Segetibacter sp.]|nr:hypothetical protein [Segetibacter sp.]